MNGYASTVGGGAMTSVTVQEKKKTSQARPKAEKTLRVKNPAIRKTRSARKKAA